MTFCCLDLDEMINQTSDWRSEQKKIRKGKRMNQKWLESFETPAQIDMAKCLFACLFCPQEKNEETIIGSHFIVKWPSISITRRRRWYPEWPFKKEKKKEIINKYPIFIYEPQSARVDDGFFFFFCFFIFLFLGFFLFFPLFLFLGAAAPWLQAKTKTQ